MPTPRSATLNPLPTTLSLTSSESTDEFGQGVRPISGGAALQNDYQSPDLTSGLESSLGLLETKNPNFCPFAFWLCYVFVKVRIKDAQPVGDNWKTSIVSIDKMLQQ